MKKLFKTLTPSIPFLMSLCIGISFLILIIGTHPWNSDLLYFEAIYRDLFTDPHPLREFQFSASPFFFPDFPLYLFFRSLTDQLNWVLLGYSTLQLFFVLVLFKDWFKERTSIAITLVALLIFAVFDPRWFTIFYPVHHGGQWILGTLILFKWGPLRHPNSHRKFWATALIVSLFSSCDILYAINGITPYGILMLIESLKKDSKMKLGKTILWCVSAFLLNFIFYFLFRKLTGSYFGWNKPLFGRWPQAILFFKEFFNLSVFSALFISSVAWLIYQFKRDILARFLLIAVLISAFSIILTGVWADHTNVRYFIPLLFAMTYALTDFIISFKENNRAAFWALSIVTVLGSGLQTKELSKNQMQSILTAPYTPAHACLDQFSRETGIKEGIGNYWPSKWLSFFSHERIKIHQVNESLEPFFWINNHEWYKDAHPRFVIVNYYTNGQISTETLKNYGLDHPLEKRNCGKFEIWSYPNETTLIRPTPAKPQYKNFNEFR